MTGHPGANSGRQSLHATTPLFALARQGITEVAVHGIAAFKFAGSSQVLCAHPSVVLPTRSLLKPWQFVACNPAGHGDGSATGPRQLAGWWAIGLASHSGQPQQMAALEMLMNAAGADENDLICPRSMPLDSSVAASVRVSGQPQRRLHHPCAGKHLVMIEACQRLGLPRDNYWDSNHPLQKRIQGLVGRDANSPVTWVTDSCGVPNAAMSLQAILGMWERFASGDDPAIRTARELWLAEPRLVGGQRRLDSDLVEASGNAAFVKEGADGLLVIQCAAVAGQPGSDNCSGTALIKLSSGYNPAHLAIAMWAMLSRINNLPKAMQQVRDYLRSRLEEWVPRDQTLILPPFVS